MNKGILSKTINELEDTITMLDAEEVESNQRIKESKQLIRELQEPTMVLNQELDRLKTITGATGESKPADLKKTEKRLESLEEQYSEAEDTITAMEDRLKEIRRELKQSHAKRDMLQYFKDENKKTNLVLKALFEGLNDNEVSEIKKVVGYNGNYLTRPKIPPNTVWTINKTVKHLMRGEDYIKFY